MTRPTKKTPAQKPAQKKTAAKKAAPEKVLVEPLTQNALKLMLELINKADIKGADAALVVSLKIELARVANVRGRE